MSVLHVRDSHFGVTDVPAVTFLMLGVLYCVRIALRGDRRDYVWAGVMIGLGASTKYGSILGLVPLGVAHLVCKPGDVSWFRWGRKPAIWLALGMCVLVFGITSPYVLLNLDGFVRDFGFQMRHVYTYGHGEDVGSGWIYHLTVTLRYGIGLLATVMVVGGIGVACVRRRQVDLVLLGLFVVFYAIIGQGRTAFFRYALPLVPLCAVFVGIALNLLRERVVVPRRWVGILCAGLVGVVVVEPLMASAHLDMLVGQDDTRAQARQWIEGHVPEGMIIANVGGPYGDVSLRNRDSVGWWLARFYWAFDSVSGSDLANFVSQFDAVMPPFYLYHFRSGMNDSGGRRHGSPDLLDNKDLAVVVTHEHPLPYSDVHADFIAELEHRAVLWQVFSPGKLDDLQHAVFDRQDAFYYPMGRFGALERGGPVVKVWRINANDGVIMDYTGNKSMIFRDTFLGVGNNRAMLGLYDEALKNYQRALDIDPDFALSHVMIGSAYIHQDRYQEALPQIRQALDLGLTIDQLEQAVILERSASGPLYVKVGIVCTMLGYYAKAAEMYEKAISMGSDAVEVYNNLGVVYDALKRYDDAMLSFQKALHLDPNYADALYNLNKVLEKTSHKP